MVILITELLIDNILCLSYIIVGRHQDAINIMVQNHNILKSNKNNINYKLNKRNILLSLALIDRYDEAFLFDDSEEEMNII